MITYVYLHILKTGILVRICRRSNLLLLTFAVATWGSFSFLHETVARIEAIQD